MPHPNGATLVIEVSENSPQIERELAFDYAAAAIPEYWIMNGHARMIDVFRNPVIDLSSGTGFRYASHRVLAETEAVAPLCKAGVSVCVADFMPAGVTSPDMTML